MSLYALVHTHNDEIEAVFIFPSAEVAVARGIDYARRSGFASPDDEWERLAADDLRDFQRLFSDNHARSWLTVKRIFTVNGSAAAPALAGVAASEGGAR